MDLQEKGKMEDLRQRPAVRKGAQIMLAYQQLPFDLRLHREMIARSLEAYVSDVLEAPAAVLGARACLS